MATLITDINGNPNVGIYCYATNKYLIIGREVEKRKADMIGKTLGLEPIITSIAGTSLVGVFIAGNDEKLLVPGIAKKEEISFLKKKLQEIGVEIGILDTRLTALSNNILINNNAAIVSPEYSKGEIERIARFFGVETRKSMLGGTHVPGSLVVMNNRNAAISNLLSSREEEMIKELLRVETERVSVNMGSPFISSGVVVNNNGLIIGNATGGAEAAMIEQALMGWNK